MRATVPVPVPEIVVARLARDADQLISATISRVRGELVLYAAVDPKLHAVSARRNLDIAVRALRSNKSPTPMELSEVAQTTKERISQGLPVEEIIQAFRISIGEIQERFLSICFEEGIPADGTLSGSRLLWVLGDAFTTRVVIAYHSFGLDNALHQAQRRTTLVRALLHGQPSTIESVNDLTGHRLNPEATYAAVRCLADPQTAERTRRAIEAAGGSTSRPALVSVDGGECIGMVTRRPVIGDNQVIGIGPQVPLRNIADSFRVASLCCDVALRLRRHGTFGLKDLSWRLAAASHFEVTAFLVARYLEPLRDEGEFGKVLEESLRVYLAHGRNIARSADVLVTHPNTLRYRLRRFTELTGLSLDSSEVLVELMWALELSELAPVLQ